MMTGTQLPEQPVVRCAGFSARGLCRAENQDRFKITGNGVVLCDGIGGNTAVAGAAMAEMACWRMTELLDGSLASPREILDEADRLICAQRYLIARAQRGQQERGDEAYHLPLAGCVANVVRFLPGGGYRIATRGDVAALLIRNGTARELNCGQSRPGEALSYLGEGVHARDLCECELSWDEARDAVLAIASDGVWRHLALEEIVTCCREAESPRNMAERLVSLAAMTESQDDRTAIICTYEG